MTFYTKSILAIFFLLTAVVSATSMLALMGKTERKLSPDFLKRTHKLSGLVFILLYLVLIFFGLRYVALFGDRLSTRAVLHAVLALTLILVLALKISLVRFYRQFLKLVPEMGMAVFILAMEVFFISAGFFFLTKWWHPTFATKQPAAVILSADAQIGRGIFEKKCSFCHYADKSENKMGPGLKGILKKEALPVSGKPAKPENVANQIINPYKNMPSFKTTISEEEIKNLLAYLETL
jgi:mono/diheme cytochrome c family protein